MRSGSGGNGGGRRGCGGGRITALALVTAAPMMAFPGIAQAQRNAIAPDQFSVSPHVQLFYDSNVLQLNDSRFTGKRDDVVVSPGVDISVSRSAGRNSLSLNAGLNYDIHRQYGFLDQERINIAGGGHAAIGAYCSVDPSVAVTRQQNNNIVANVGDTLAGKNRQTYQRYSATGQCRRPVGFFPSVTVTHERYDNSASLLRYADQRITTVSGGIGYTAAGLGSVLVSVGRTMIDQPERYRDPLTGRLGLIGGSDVMSYGVTLERSVAPRISFVLGGSYLSVDPKDPSVRKYDGGGFNASVDYHPSPRLSLVLAGSRSATSTGNASVAYVLQTQVTLTGSTKLSQRSSANLSAGYYNYDYRGENPLLFIGPRGSDKIASVRGGYNYRLGRIINIGAFASYTDQMSSNNFYSYSRFQGGVSLGATF